MRIDELKELSIFEKVSDERLEKLLEVGRTIEIEPGLQLFTEGHPADDWWVLVDGAVDLFRTVGRDAARPLGRRVPRLGRRRRLPRDRPGRRLRPAAQGVGVGPARADRGVAAAG